MSIQFVVSDIVCSWKVTAYIKVWLEKTFNTYIPFAIHNRDIKTL